jgi:hypothetical protein
MAVKMKLGRAWLAALLAPLLALGLALWLPVLPGVLLALLKQLRWKLRGAVWGRKVCPLMKLRALLKLGMMYG